MDLFYHAGLGDAIIYNGMTRYYCKLYDSINIMINIKNEKNIKFMFKDLKNLNYIIWKQNGTTYDYVFDEKINSNNSDYFKWYYQPNRNGTFNMNDNPNIIRATNKNQNLKFDESMYNCAGLHIDIK